MGGGGWDPGSGLIYTYIYIRLYIYIYNLVKNMGN